MSEGLKPGWYWARDVAGPQPMRWEVVEVALASPGRSGELVVYTTGWECGSKLEAFEFGPRIEEPTP